jgi:hypothetical protein
MLDGGYAQLCELSLDGEGECGIIVCSFLYFRLIKKPNPNLPTSKKTINKKS